MPIPKYLKNKVKHGEPHLVKPDLDNLIKAVKDALTGTIIVDDKAIYCYKKDTKKIYSNTPGIEVFVTELTNY